MSTAARSARKRYCSALMSFVVVSAAVLYVWMPGGQVLAVTVSQRGWEGAGSGARVDGRKQAAQRTTEIVYRKVSDPKGTLTGGTARVDGREQAGAQRTAEIVFRKVSGAKGTLTRGTARVDGREQARAKHRAEIVYGKVSGPSGALTRGTAVFACPRHGSIKRNFGSPGVFRKVLHRRRETCAFVLRADFAGQWYSAHGALKLKPGHAYYINATLKATGLFVVFPLETY